MPLDLQNFDYLMLLNLIILLYSNHTSLLQYKRYESYEFLPLLKNIFFFFII